MFEEIGIDKEIEKAVIKNLLSDVLKDCRIHYFDLFDTWEIEDEDLLGDNSICFSFIKNESEFPIKIQLTRTPEENYVEREQYLAKIISDRLTCRTIASYKEPNTPDDYPLDSIIFEKGLAYFAIDDFTVWANGEGGEVEIVREIDFVNHTFDNRGKIIKGSH